MDELHGEEGEERKVEESAGPEEETEKEDQETVDTGDGGANAGDEREDREEKDDDEKQRFMAKNGTEEEYRETGSARDEREDGEKDAGEEDQRSPRTVLDAAASSSVDSEDSGSVGEVSSAGAHTLQWRSMISGLLLGRRKSMIRAVTFPPRSKSSGLRQCIDKMRLGKHRKGTDAAAVMAGPGAAVVIPDASKWRPSWKSFDLHELEAATAHFSQDNLIGKGGHAEVYKGQLSNGELVAVKRLTKGDREEDRIADFLSELGIIAHVSHPNAAQLLGFSSDGGLHLVLRFSHHGSLASLLHGSKEGLDWPVRFKIAQGIAEGLLYLHEGCHRRIIHRDIKASNILLTEDYRPQISDFGLAKWLPDNWAHHVVFPIEGTFGYLAPEYFMHGIVNEKTDIFAFGVLLLELVTGRKAIDEARQSLVIWAKPRLDANNVEELVDPSMAEAYDPDEMARLLAVASSCIHHIPALRPTMSSVVRFFKDRKGAVELVEKPKAAKSQPFDVCVADDYTRSRYLNDLHRHKQIAMEQ